jgi:hypothetical protein
MKLFGSRERKDAIRALPSDDARNYAKHARTLQEAADVMLHRTARYGGTYRQYGALANLLQGATAVNRLMATWWFNTGDRPAFHKDVLDDAYDAINYLAFFIALATEGDVVGAPPDLSLMARNLIEAVED